IIDKRFVGTECNVVFTGNLREEQEEAASVLPCYDTGVLCARYGFWQVTAAAVIARRTYTGTPD
ncbi:DNA primase, partial [Escherichia coli]|nr:DNA primase [Escherichia coli]